MFFRPSFIPAVPLSFWRLKLLHCWKKKAVEWDRNCGVSSGALIKRNFVAMIDYGQCVQLPLPIGIRMVLQAIVFCRIQNLPWGETPPHRVVSHPAVVFGDLELKVLPLSIIVPLWSGIWEPVE